MNRLIKVIVATAALTGTALAHAVHLGDLRGSSTLGEPFAASIPLYAPAAGELDSANVEVIADPLLARRPGMRRILDSLSAGIVNGPSGPYITVRSSVPVNELILSFRIRLSNGTNSVSRSYSAIIDPAPRRSAGRSRAAATPVAAAADSYGPVRPGETLWKIAKSIGNRYGGSTNAIMAALVDANPQAFIGGDMNRLIAGATLQLPASISGVTPAPRQSVVTQTATPRPATASVAVTAERASAGSTASTPARPAAATAAAAPTTAAATTVTVARATAATAAPRRTVQQRRVDWRENKPELATRLAAMDAKFAALRERYGAPASSSGAAASPASEPVAPEAPAPVAAAEPVTAQPVVEEPGAVVEAAPAVEAAVDIVATPEAGVEATDAEAPADPAPTADSEAAKTVVQDAAPAIAAIAPAAVRTPVDIPAQPARIGERVSVVLALIPFKLLGLLALGGLAMWAAWRSLAGHLKRNRAETAERVHHDLEAERRAEVARKARQRLDLEAEVRRIVDDHEDTKAKLAEAGLQDLTGSASAAGYEGSMTEIDMSITHGRYQRAEQLLREVISEAPRNTAARLRLAEVYYITERVKEFVTEVRELRDSHRENISDSDWQKLMRMGKVAAPEDPLFGGLASVPGVNKSA